VTETPAQVEQRHEQELLEAMPNSIDDLKTAFSNLPELISHFHHLSRVHEKNEAEMLLLKGRFELLVNRLFDERKVVIQEKGVVKAEEEFLGLVDDLGYLGLHLYIDPFARDNRLHLLLEGETESDPAYEGFREIDLRDLSADDIILDPTDFTAEKPSVHPVSDEEKTAVMAPHSYVWTSKVVSITPRKAWELRHAA
jgi:hypothetical protein